MQRLTALPLWPPALLSMAWQLLRRQTSTGLTTERSPALDLPVQCDDCPDGRAQHISNTWTPTKVAAHCRAVNSCECSAARAPPACTIKDGAVMQMCSCYAAPSCTPSASTAASYCTAFTLLTRLPQKHTMPASGLSQILAGRVSISVAVYEAGPVMHALCVLQRHCMCAPSGTCMHLQGCRFFGIIRWKLVSAA